MSTDARSLAFDGWAQHPLQELQNAVKVDSCCQKGVECPLCAREDLPTRQGPRAPLQWGKEARPPVLT